MTVEVPYPLRLVREPILFLFFATYRPASSAISSKQLLTSPEESW